MKLTKGQVISAGKAFNQIAEQNPVIPQLAKAKLAKMWIALEPYFTPIEAARLGLIQKWGKEQLHPQTQQPMGWGLFDGDENYPKYLEEWKPMSEEDAGEIPVKPITTTMLGNDPKGIGLQELVWLGPLLVDNSEE